MITGSQSVPNANIRDRFSDSIIENVNVWLNAYDTHLNLVLWNPMAEKISGYSAAEVIGHAKIWEWLYPDEAYRQSLISAAQAVTTQNNSLENYETRICCKNGQEKTISWNSRSLTDEHSEVYAVITFGYDITDRKQAEEALQKAHAELSVLYQEARQLAVMEERRRLARDLHDSATQALFSLTLFAEAGERLLQSGQLKEAQTYLAWLKETAQSALKEMRLLIYELRPAVLKPGGLVEALQQRLNAVERHAGLKAHLIVDQPIELPLLAEEELYHIIQEALNNSLKHAAATSVMVRLQPTEAGVEAKITDNGIGFDNESARQKGGMGLINMRERVERLGGQLAIASQPGKGVEITITFNPAGLTATEAQP